MIRSRPRTALRRAHRLAAPAALVGAVLVLLFLGFFVRAPLLYRLRPLPALVPLVAMGVWVLARRHLRGVALSLCGLGLILAGTASTMGTVAHLRARSRVLAADPALVARLGRHLVVGYEDPGAVEDQVARGGVGGLFVTGRNVQGHTRASLADELNRMQALSPRRLFVMADQEGGPVSRLSPPLPRLPRLARVTAEGHEDLEARARRYGRDLGLDLASVGVNVDLAPVVDVPDGRSAPAVDLHTRLSDRALAMHPETVGRIARAFARGLEDAGVVATLKHFPGLGRIDRDTHFFAGRLGADLDTLAASDWLPYRMVLPHSAAWVMVGHVHLDAVDPEGLASTSPTVIQELVRGRLEHRGVVISDDLCMGPIFHGEGGIGAGAVRALNAGVDLLLVSFDPSQYWEVMDALLEAHAEGRLDLRRLEESDRRLDRPVGGHRA